MSEGEFESVIKEAHDRAFQAAKEKARELNRDNAQLIVGFANIFIRNLRGKFWKWASKLTETQKEKLGIFVDADRSSKFRGSISFRKIFLVSQHVDVALASAEAAADVLRNCGIDCFAAEYED